MINRKSIKSALVVGSMLIASAAMPVAANNKGGPTTSGDLSANRASADLIVPALCESPVNVGDTKTGTLTVYIFQPSGRLLNIGIGTADVPCDGTQANVMVTVDAIPGLKFKPGPATVVYAMTEQTMDSAGAVTASSTTESGATVNLRP